MHLSLVIAPYVELVYESVHGAIPDGVKFRFRHVISDDDMDDLGHLLRAPADPNHGLEWAAFYAHDEAMRLLLDAAADPNYEIWHYFEAIGTAIPTTALHIAITEGDNDDPNERQFVATVVEQLRAAGANVDAVDGEGDTPVTVATRCGNSDALRLLCAAQANLDTSAPQGDENCGNTALQKAAHEEMVSATP